MTPDTSRNPAGGRWPAFTDLFRGPNGIQLLQQHHEVRIVIRNALTIIKEKLIFDNPFPLIVDRLAWNQQALVDACALVVEKPGPKSVKDRYSAIKSCVRLDGYYASQISTLVGRAYTCQG